MMKRIYDTWLLMICTALLAGCSIAPALPETMNPPRTLPWQVPENREKPIVALALGSGAARGFAHVGALKVLEESGIEADIVVGSSAGSVVGVLYCGGIRGDALIEAARQLDMWQLTDWTLPDRGVIGGEELQAYVNKQLQGRMIEALDTPFVAVATNLESGEAVLFNSGDPGMAVRASSAIPGVVSPVNINGRDYVDGGLVSQVPVRIARQLGADVVIAIDVSRQPLPKEELESTLGVLQQSFIIMQRRIAEDEVAEADVVIRPAVGEIAVGEFSLREETIAAGKAAAQAALPEIKQLLAGKTREKKAAIPDE
jgi:NTE family protein